MMKSTRMAVAPLLVLMAACGNDQTESAAADAAARAFQQDLELAVSKPTALETVSPVELGFAEEGQATAEAETPPAAPARSTSSTPAPARRTASSSSATSPGTYEAPAPVARTEVVRNTKRDAAIGAGAGAVIGAVAGGSDNRLRGAAIGAVLGGAAGAVIGHTIDTDTRTIYE
jgi:hypothetical protein